MKIDTSRGIKKNRLEKEIRAKAHDFCRWIEGAEGSNGGHYTDESIKRQSKIQNFGGRYIPKQGKENHLVKEAFGRSNFRQKSHEIRLFWLFWNRFLKPRKAF